VSTIDEEDVEMGEEQMYTGDAESYEHAAHNHDDAYDSQDFGDNNGYADDMYDGEQHEGAMDEYDHDEEYTFAREVLGSLADDWQSTLTFTF
jgi:hypothetical protein